MATSEFGFISKVHHPAAGSLPAEQMPGTHSETHGALPDVPWQWRRLVQAFASLSHQLDRYSQASSVALPCVLGGVVIFNVIRGPTTCKGTRCAMIVPAPE